MRNATSIPEEAIKLEDVKEIVPEIIIVRKKMVITQRRLDFYSFCPASLRGGPSSPMENL